MFYDRIGASLIASFGKTNIKLRLTRMDATSKTLRGPLHRFNKTPENVIKGLARNNKCYKRASSNQKKYLLHL